jgi:hypothetical protein
VPANRARGIDPLDHKCEKIEFACTIRVVWAAKLLKKLVLHALSLLSLPSIKAFAGTCAR